MFIIFLAVCDEETFQLQNITKNYIRYTEIVLAVPLVDGVFVFRLQVVGLDGLLGQQPGVRTEGPGPGQDPGGQELVPPVLLHALHEHGPVVVVSVHHGCQ